MISGNIPKTTIDSHAHEIPLSKEKFSNLAAKLKDVAVKVDACVQDPSKNYLQISNEARDLKKVVKQIIKDKEVDHKTAVGKIKGLFSKSSSIEIANLKSQYKELETSYDKLVYQSPALQLTREVSQILRRTNRLLIAAGGNMEKLDMASRSEIDRLCEKFSIFDKKFKLFTAPKNSLASPQWNHFRSRLINAHEELKTTEAMKTHKLTWLHGTRSPAMEVMLATDKTMHPAGELLEHHIIPLTGELGIGIVPGAGVNNNNISGTSLSKTGVDTTLSYAQDFKVVAKDEWGQLTLKNLRSDIEFARKIFIKEPQLDGKFGGGVKFSFLKAALYVGRLKVIDQDFHKNVGQLKNDLNLLIKECQIKKDEKIIPYLEKILNECDSPPFIQPTPQIRASVANSFPLILGSTEIEGKAHFKDLDEHIVAGSISLNRIQVAFTDTENIEKLRDNISKAGLKIEVMSFDALLFLGISAPLLGNNFEKK